MRHGGPKEFPHLTFAHGMTELLTPGTTYMHNYPMGSSTQQTTHQHFECAYPNYSPPRSYGANNRGPFTKKADAQGYVRCIQADELGQPIDPQDPPIMGGLLSSSKIHSTIFGDTFIGCMDWEGNNWGMTSVGSCYPMCTCRDSYLDEEGMAQPIDVHRRKNSDGTPSIRGITALHYANVAYNDSLDTLIEWDNLIKTTNSVHQIPLPTPAPNRDNPPSDFPPHMLLGIQEGTPAPEQQVGYYCDCPAGVHGKNCEIVTDFCDPDHANEHPYEKCVVENTDACIHNTTLTERHCVCKAGYLGPTCSIRDECHPNFGKKCIHGTCRSERVLQTLDKFHHKTSDPDYSECANAASPNPVYCAAWANEMNCIGEFALGMQNCCAECYRKYLCFCIRRSRQGTQTYLF
jgi:hypothetical protein